ncbi:MAG: hypothetical protein ACKVP2_12175 [Burkholderiales bacterium]
MRILTFFEYALIALGVIGYFAGQHFGLVKGGHLGIFLVGAGLAVAGLESLNSRVMSLRFSPEAAESYAGFPALVWGGMLLAIGSGVIAIAYLLDAGKWANAVVFVQRNYGVIYLAAGGLLVGFSILAFVNNHYGRRWWETLLFRVPRVLLAVLMLVGGAFAMGAGAWQLIDPKGYVSMERQALTKVQTDLKKMKMPDRLMFWER